MAVEESLWLLVVGVVVGLAPVEKVVPIGCLRNGFSMFGLIVVVALAGEGVVVVVVVVVVVDVVVLVVVVDEEAGVDALDGITMVVLVMGDESRLVSCGLVTELGGEAIWLEVATRAELGEPKSTLALAASVNSSAPPDDGFVLDHKEAPLPLDELGPALAVAVVVVVVDVVVSDGAGVEAAILPLGLLLGASVVVGGVEGVCWRSLIKLVRFNCI